MKNSFIIIAALLLVMFCTISSTALLLKDNRRLKDNISALNSGMQRIETKNGELIAKVGVLTLTNEEIRRDYSEVKTELKNQGIRMRELDLISNTSTETVRKITTELRDSIIISERIDTLKAIRYKDAWLSLDGVIDDNTFTGKIECRDSIIQVVYWQRPVKILFTHWGRKQYFQNITSANPYTKITFSRVIVPVKSKKQ